MTYSFHGCYYVEIKQNFKVFPAFSSPQLLEASASSRSQDQISEENRGWVRKTEIILGVPLVAEESDRKYQVDNHTCGLPGSQRAADATSG